MKSPILILLTLLSGTISFTQNIDFTLADPQPDLVEIYFGSSDSGDIDGDGDNDLIMTGITPAARTVLYKNDGLGNFAAVDNTPIPIASNGLVIFKDLDGDGDLDLFCSGIANTIQEFAHIYLNDGQGAFTQKINPSLPQFAESGVQIADVDGDGDEDLLIAVKDKEDNFIADIFLNDGNALFTPAGLTIFTPVQFASVAFIDVENDGDADVIISGKQEDQTGSILLYLNDGAGNYSMSNSTGFIQVKADDVDVADTDNDGDLDVLVSGNTDALEVLTSLYINDGLGQFTELASADLQNTFAGANAIADLDNDGDQDIVIVGSQDGGLPNIYNIVYENMGNNIFSPVDTVGGEYIAACVIDDFNGDALADLIIQGFADRTSAYWNTTILSNLDKVADPQLFKIFPNPTSGKISLVLENNDAAYQFNIYTITGQLVHHQVYDPGVTSETQINLKAGTYLAVLYSENAMVAKELLIVK